MYRRDAEGWLSGKVGVSLVISQHWVSTCGSRMVAFEAKKHFGTHWPGEDPRPFIPTGLVEPKCWYLKNEGFCWKQGCTSLQVAHHNLTRNLYFPNKIGIVWEVGGNGKAGVNSIADVDGYNSIRCLSLHITAAAHHRFASFFQKVQTKRHWNHLVLKIFENGNLDRPKPWDADSKHVLCLFADTSSRLGYFFFGT